MRQSLARRSAVVVTGLGLAAGLMGAPGAAADVRSMSAPGITAGSASTYQNAEPAPGMKCRKARSVIRGAKATATICWWSKKRGGWRGASIDGRIYDTRSDGKYAAFKIHWRSRKGRPWKSHTRVLETTEGDYAPTSTRVKSYREKWYPIKDLWIKACRSDGACDRYWR